MKQIIEYFNKLNDQVRYAILVFVIFLIILGDIVFLILPQMNSIATTNDQIKQLTDDTGQGASYKQRIRQLKKGLAQEKDDLSALNVKIRTIQEIPSILSNISSIANEYGIKIDQLVPERSLQEVLTSTSDTNYYALPIVMRAHGGYHMFGRFLNKLESQNMYVIMKDFIVQNDESASNSRLFSLTIKIILLDNGQNPSKHI